MLQRLGASHLTVYGRIATLYPPSPFDHEGRALDLIEPTIWNPYFVTSYGIFKLILIRFCIFYLIVKFDLNGQKSLDERLNI